MASFKLWRPPSLAVSSKSRLSWHEPFLLHLVFKNQKSTALIWATLNGGVMGHGQEEARKFYMLIKTRMDDLLCCVACLIRGEGRAIILVFLGEFLVMCRDE